MLAPSADNEAVDGSYLPGVQPVSPGYQTWQVVPQPRSLSWAEGQVPTPLGAVTGATFLQRSGNYDVHQVGSGTFQFSSGPATSS